MTKPIKKSKAPDPEKYALSGSEDAAQISLCMWAAKPEVRERYPELKWLFAIPNGGYRSKSEAGRLVAMGVKGGVSDLFLPVKRGRFSGLFIEMKRPKTERHRAGTASDEQKIFGSFVQSQGFGFAVCQGYEPARQIIIDYLDNGAKY